MKKAAMFLAATLCLAGSAFAQRSLHKFPSEFVGKWGGPYEALSMIESTPRSDNWQGQMTGEISSTGLLSLKSDDGCQLRGAMGLIDHYILGDVDVIGCPNPDFNRQYMLTGTKSDGMLILLFARIKVLPSSEYDDLWEIAVNLERQ